MDNLELIAAAENAERQHVGGVNDFARHVNRHIAHDLAAGLRRLPFAGRRERQILEQHSGAGDDTGGGGHFHWCFHCAVLLAMKASRPSTASCVVINPSR